MSFKSSVWAGRFGTDSLEPISSIPEDRFSAIFNRFADLNSWGKPVAPLKRPGWEQFGTKKLMGYLAREYVIYQCSGFVEVVFVGIDPRLIRFLVATTREMGCQLIDSDSGECLTNYFLALAEDIKP